jgi:alpha-galactosidase
VRNGLGAPVDLVLEYTDPQKKGDTILSKKLWSLSFCSLLIVVQATAQSWTIGNAEVQRTIAFSESAGLSTERLSDLKTHADYIPQPHPSANGRDEFSFQCGGQSYTGAGTQFALIGANEESIAHGKQLTVRLRAKAIPLEVAVVYAVYDGHPAIRKHLVLRNTGSAELRISHLSVESIAPSVGPENEVSLNTQYGVLPREIFYTGRSEDAGLFVANARSGIGFAILSEVPGYMKRTEIGGWNEENRVPIRVLYDTDLMPFEHLLKPGEQFESAKVSLLTFRNGDGFRDPHWVVPTYTAKVLMRRVDAKGAPWIFNTWEPFERDIDRDTTMKLLDVASEMGVDIFTIDDGWQEEYGENEINLKAFPDGLKPILEAVEAKGMRLGLWIPIAAIGTSTAEYRNHPEWAALDQEGTPKSTGTAAGLKAVMCLASPFRTSAADRINDAIEKFHLAYVKLDLTTIFNAYGEAPGCWAKGHDHQNWSQSLNAIYEGISFVTNRVYEKHPDVLIDLTFELWGQKHVIDAGLLAAGDLDWLSNVDDNKPGSAGPLQARTLLYQRALSIPVESMLIGNLHGEMPSVQERFATAIGSAPLLLGDLRKLSAADRQWYHKKVAWFKKLRATTKISESFFPLGSWLQPSASQWDGFARLEHSGNGVIALFGNKSGAATANVQLPLIPEGKFKLYSVTKEKDLGTFTKADWTRGVAVSISKPEAVEVLQISRAE